MTALVVIPFAGSALLSLGRCFPLQNLIQLQNPIINCSLVTTDLILPFIGFFYLIMVVGLIARYSRIKV